MNFEKIVGPTMKNTKVLGKIIDPSCLIKKTNCQSLISDNNSWWVPVKYKDWDLFSADKKWLTKTKDIPDFKYLIEVNNPKDNSNWLILESYFSLEQPTPIDKDKYKISRREIYFMLKSYFIKKKDRLKIWNWAQKKNWYGRWMPESHEQTNIYLGEFFNSKAFDFHNIPYYCHDGWKKPKSNNSCEILVSTDQYMQEKGYDCSIDETISIHIPNELIFEEMKLNWHGIAGQYYDQNNNLVAFDPSIDENGPSSLLIKKEPFLEFIKNSNYDIFWTVTGEKQILGGFYNFDEYKGRLQINGSYRIIKNKIEGKLNAFYESPDHH